MRRFVHEFLKWAGPTIVLFCGGCVGLVAALAQSYPRVKEWGQIRFDQWWPIVTAPWFLFAAALVIAAYVWALLWTGQADQNPSAVQYHFHNHNYAPLAELADPIDLAPKPERAFIQPDNAVHGHTATSPAVTHHLAAASLETKRPEIGQSTLTVNPPDEFPSGLYVGMVIAAASKLSDPAPSVEIAARAFNGTGRKVRIVAVQGFVRGGAGNLSDLPNLPEPTWQHDPLAQPIEPGGEFMAVLEQHVSPALAADFLETLKTAPIILDFRNLDIVVEDFEKPALRTRLPIWDAVTIQRRDDVFTGRIVFASLIGQAVTVATASVSGVITRSDGSRESF